MRPSIPVVAASPYRGLGSDAGVSVGVQVGLGMQALSLHTMPAAHARPQTPQLLGSLVRSGQAVPEQRGFSGGHWKPLHATNGTSQLALMHCMHAELLRPRVPAPHGDWQLVVRHWPKMP
jgi:hypothetical protein